MLCYNRGVRFIMRGTSPILVTAALSVAALVAASGLRIGAMYAPTTIAAGPRVPVEMPQYLEIEDADQNGTPDWQDELAKSGVVINATSSLASTSTDPLSFIGEDIAEALYGGYLSLKRYGEYTPSRGEQLAETIVQNIRAPQLFVAHSVDELTLSPDMTEKNVLEYRAHMREALAPMVTDDPPEFELFARYLETKDGSWLLAIADAAKRYRIVERNMLDVAVPQDAAPEHLRALNAVGSYADTLERLALFGTDALASIALIQSQNANEEEMLYAFDSLAQYYVRKVAN